MTDFAATPARSRRALALLREDWRLVLLMICFVAIYLTVALRMGLLAAAEPQEPQTARASQPALSARGEIVDRRGALMAANLPGWSLYAHPRAIKHPVAVAAALADIFPEIGKEELIEKLASKKRFVWIKRPLTPRQKQAVHDLGVPGLFFGSREMRIYPAGRTAAHVLGGVKPEREDVRFAEFAGAGGVESRFDEDLRNPARVTAPLELSLDLQAQEVMRSVLADGVRRFTAKGAAGVLMSVETGEIIAMASLPDFDPNRRPKHAPNGAAADPGLDPRFNRAAQGRYELGSTFKVLTTAMALDLGLASPNTMLETPNRIVLGRRSIRDFHKMPERMSVEEIVVKSSNVGTVKLSMMIGTRRFREYLDALGMMSPSGLELAEAGVAPLVPRDWTELSTATISFGHGLATTPVHLAAAYATLANEGRRVFPTLVKGGRPVGEAVFTPKTARAMLNIMREVVRRGTARRGDVPGYEVAGKTGTAEKVRPTGGYYNDKVMSTFAAVFPSSDPKYALVVSLDEPVDRSGRYPVRTAGRTAVPVAAEMIARVAPILGLRPVETPAGAPPAAIRIGSGD